MLPLRVKCPGLITQHVQLESLLKEITELLKSI